MSGGQIKDAYNLIDEVYAIKLAPGEQVDTSTFTERIKAIGYGDCHNALEILMMNQEARTKFQEESTSPFAIVVNQVIALAVLAGQTTREQMLLEYGIKKS
jgi:hypothetical protein